MTYTLDYGIEDEKGKVGHCEVNIPTAVLVADVILFAADMAQLIDAMVDGRIVSINGSFSITLPGGIKGTVTAGADREEGARFGFDVTGGVFKTAVRIPTFKESLIVAGSSIVDLEDSDVAAFVDAMTDGIDPAGGATGLIQPCDKRNTDIITLGSALENFQGSRGRVA